jgi:hypothetical protein
MPSYFRRIDYTAALNRACGFLATDRGPVRTISGYEQST